MYQGVNNETIFTCHTYIGYILRGLPGALLATLGIFLPCIKKLSRLLTAVSGTGDFVLSDRRSR